MKFLISFLILATVFAMAESRPKCPHPKIANGHLAKDEGAYVVECDDGYVVKEELNLFKCFAGLWIRKDGAIASFPPCQKMVLGSGSGGDQEE